MISKSVSIFVIPIILLLASPCFNQSFATEVPKGNGTWGDPLAEIGASEKELAYCTNVLAYGVNWMLLHDNQGAARVLILHYARANASLATMGYEKGKVPGDRLSTWKEIGGAAKPYLDEHPDRVITTIDSCVAISKRHAAIQSKRGVKVWGKTWDEMVDYLASTIRIKFGL